MSMIRSTRFAGALVAVSAAFAATTAAADTGSVVVLRTATQMIKDSPAGRIGRLTGAGVMDTTVSVDPTGHIFMAWTDSVQQPNNNNSYLQGAIAVADLTETGLQAGQPIALPRLNGDRTFMRPQAGIGTNFMMTIFASEDNGNNNNPQAVAWVFDRTGKMINIDNTTRGTQAKPTNLIDLSGKQDGQQYGPHSICAMGVQPDGSESWILGLQRNNQAAYVMRVNVKADAQGNAHVTVPYLNQVLGDARHCRPQIECQPPGATPLTRTTRVLTTVEANNQPADIGVRAILFDVNTGNVVRDANGNKVSKLIAASNPGKNLYAVQPSVASISEGVVAIEWQKSSNARGNREAGNGHTGGENLSMLTTLKVATDGTGFTKLDEISRPAPYQRHAHSFGALYGGANGGVGAPAIAIMGGSSTGTGRGLTQVIPIDGATGKITAPDASLLFQVSTFSDVANIPARGKRNPNDQGAGFITGTGGLMNPGYQKPNGFMPEVRAFTVSAVPGFKDAATSTMLDGNNRPIGRDSLFLSLIPASWDPAKQVTPGPATDTSQIQPGPSPTTSTPQAQGGGGDTSSGGGGSDPFGNPSGDNGSGTGDGTGDPSLGAQSGGCAVAPASTSSTGTGLAGLALAALGLVFAARRRNKKEQ